MNIYDLDFDTMLHILEELKKSYDIELARLEVAVHGHLTGTHRHGRQNYLQTEIINGKYLRHGLSKDPDTLKQLCRKAYLKEALDEINNNIKCLTGAKSRYANLQPDEIIGHLPKVYRTVPKAYFFPDTMKDLLAGAAEEDSKIAAKVKAWIEEPYEQSTYMQEKRVHTTSRGEKMRSKNEVLHAEVMYRLGIPFRYEPVLHIGANDLIPDFMILRIRDAKIFYAEHCGMPFNKRYMEHHKWKMELYEAAGIVPWDSLIVTYGDVHGNIDVRIIESELKSKLL